MRTFHLQGHLMHRAVSQRRPSSDPTPERQPNLSAEHLWTVRNGNRSFAAELVRNHRGLELRFSSNGHWFASQSAGSREVAKRSASTVLDDLIADGWLKASSDDAVDR